MAAALTWLAGIGVQMQRPALWPLAHYLALLLVALCLALALAGFGSTGWRAGERLSNLLPAELEGQDLQATGVITGQPQPGPQGTRFVLQVEQAQRDGLPVRVPGRVSLGWYCGFDGDALIAAPAQELRAGQRWLLTVRLRQPHGTLNPGGFDLELWMFEQDLRARGTVRAAPGAPDRKLADAVGHPLDRARQTVRDAILLQVPDAQAAIDGCDKKGVRWAALSLIGSAMGLACFRTNTWREVVRCRPARGTARGQKSGLLGALGKS
jgi:competence protein ComEC